MTKVRAVLRRRWPVLVAGLLLGAVAGALSAALAPEGDAITRFKVNQLIIANPGASSGGVEQDALRVTRGDIAAAASEALGEPNARSKVVAVADPDTSSILVSSTNTDPTVAQKRVTAFVDAFLAEINGDVIAAQQETLAQYQQQVDDAAVRLADFDARNPQVTDRSLLFPGTAVDPILIAERQTLQEDVANAQQLLRQQRLSDQRVLPYSTLGPDPAVDAASDLLPVPTGLPFRIGLLGVFGVALAVGLVMVVERLFPRIDTRDELVATVELPVLAEVGYFSPRRLPREEDGTLRIEGAWAEPYRRIRSAVQFVQSDAGSAGRGPRVFMVTSASPSEGKSTTTMVTALALAEAGERTLVVGGDFRRPSIHRLAGVPAAPGIREHARLDVERPTLEQIVHPTSHEHLYVAPSGAPGKEVVGLADAAKSLIAEAVADGATVLVDTSPVEVANDAIDLLPAVDHVILVVRSGRTSRKSLLSTFEQLQQHGARILGTALIGTPGLAKQQYYYEGYYAAEPANEATHLFPDDGPDAGPTITTASAATSPEPEPAPAALSDREPASPTNGALRPSSVVNGRTAVWAPPLSAEVDGPTGEPQSTLPPPLPDWAPGGRDER